MTRHSQKRSPSFYLLIFFIALHSFCFVLFSIHPKQSFPPCIFPSSSPLLKIHSCVCLQKRAGLPWILTKYRIKRCQNTGHKPSYQGQTRQPSRRKRLLGTGERVKDTIRSPTEHQANILPSSLKKCLHFKAADKPLENIFFIFQSSVCTHTVMAVS